LGITRNPDARTYNLLLLYLMRCGTAHYSIRPQLTPRIRSPDGRIFLFSPRSSSLLLSFLKQDARAAIALTPIHGDAATS